MGLEVEVKVFNMRFWGNGFRHENIWFVPRSNHRDLLRQAKRGKYHVETGKATVSIPEEAKNPDEAINYSKDLLKYYETLLIFSHCHDVFFRNYKCYESKNGSRNLRKEKNFAIVMRKPPISGPIIYPLGIKEFIRKSIPQIRDDKFAEETRIIQALDWFNEALTSYPAPVEIKFSNLFFSLEILANTYAKTAELGDFLTEYEYEVIEGVIEELIKNKKIDPSKRDILFGKLGNVKRKPIRNKISELLNHYDLEGYEGEIKKFRDLRVEIVHGKEKNTDLNKKEELRKKLQRLLQKLILSIFDYYDSENVYRAIKDQNLLAR
ncbi:hypothetical protein AKJ43_02265 [candidate division MSBL1 archaeon SCGC-AAA261D19]|uniref:Apea-like HEPN domain-containing protein n=1 Tax=candidate division MSBL1 archaeon SCGC-AAA261D19 TaxID=1698273 RepID=A0A133V6W5_9EURY|nr:hypothetical protein AKJ43_02265 [candidate division MSBL1 archaeon SCGC-AAA261D19]